MKRPPKLVRVAGHPSFTFRCARCQRVVRTLRVRPAWADLSGRPFFDYYCEVCANVTRKDVQDVPVEGEKGLGEAARRGQGEAPQDRANLHGGGDG